MRLYEIPHAIRAIEAMIEELEGEITPEIESKLNALEGEFSRKAEFIALMVKEATTAAAAIKAEEDRISARRKAHERRAEAFKDYLHRCMASMGVSKITGQLASPAIQRNSAPSVTVDIAPELLPERFRRVLVGPDNRALADAFKAGEALPAGVTAEYGTHLRIR
jgi:hypothetical protein